MCNGTFDPSRTPLGELVSWVKGPDTKKKTLHGGAASGFGSAMTDASTNDAGNTTNVGNKYIRTDKASLSERMKESAGATSIGADILGITGQRNNIKYVLAPGQTVQGTKRVL